MFGKVRNKKSLLEDPDYLREQKECTAGEKLLYRIECH